jgi:hypothetical protein
MRQVLLKLAAMGLLLAACGGGSPPDDLSPGIVKSSPRVRLAEKRAVDGVNIITDIELTSDGRIIAVGSDGVAVLSPTLTPVSSRPLTGTNLVHADSIIRADLSKSVVVASTFDGNPQITAFRLDGTPLWKYVEQNPLVSGTHGLLPETGPSGVVVVSHKERGLLLLDSESGAVIKTFKAPFAPEVRTGDLDGDGTTEIAQMSDSGLEVRSNTGQLVGHRPIVASWTIAKGLRRPDALVMFDHGAFLMLGPDLVTQQTLPAAFKGSDIPALHLEAAASSRTTQGDWFAFLLGGRGGWHRTTLLLYDLRGELIYQETLPDDFMTVRFVSPDSLLVGGRNALRRYEIRRGTA